MCQTKNCERLPDIFPNGVRAKTKKHEHREPTAGAANIMEQCPPPERLTASSSRTDNLPKRESNCDQRRQQQNQQSCCGGCIPSVQKRRGEHGSSKQEGSHDIARIAISSNGKSPTIPLSATKGEPRMSKLRPPGWGKDALVSCIEPATTAIITSRTASTDAGDLQSETIKHLPT